MGLNYDPKTFIDFRDFAAADNNLKRTFAERMRGDTHPQVMTSWSYYPTGMRPRSTKAELKHRVMRLNRVS